MPVVTKCTHCQKPSQVPDNLVGRQVRCPSCKNVFTVQAAAAAAAAAPSPSVSQSIQISPAQLAAATGGGKCPACQSPLPGGATVCLVCGWVQAEIETGKGDGEQMVLCTNPACAVANPPTERYCVRCNTMLPTAPGTMLHNRYKIDKLLAMGGFGAVYLATDTKSGDKVAIKDMICADPDEFNIRLNFFRREAEILRSLSTLPVVPRVYDFIHQGQSAHLVLEFIRGRDLLKIMEDQKNKPFPLDLVVEWGKLICDVLQHMHTLSPPIVHRDMKPDNIMLLEDGKSIKLIDFGTARDIGRTHKTRLQAKTRVYTEGYAPPEQIIGKPEARSDLFALAGTLYHLATGKSPEGFYTAKELEQQLQGGNGTLPPEFRWFYELLKINLAEDVNDRYFSAREIKADLQGRKVTSQVACSSCQTVNKVREPYCTKCAAPLTDQTPPCYHCGKMNRMGSRCCIHCGNRLR
jgi:predicted Ser/Thr protein kinase